nr:MFS transporter [Clostridia bacterium]
MTRLKPAPLRDIKLSRVLFAMCWCAYAAAYTGRLNLSAAIATIVDGGIMDKAETGIISTVFFFCYGAGQIVMGYIADRLNARKMIGIGVLGSAAMNALMTLYPSPLYMSLVWGLNGIFQSMLWAPILYIISNEICEETRVRAGVLIASSPLVGTLVAYFAAALTANIDWRGVFLISSATLILMGVVWFVSIGYITKKAPETVEVEARGKAKAQTADGNGTKVIGGGKNLFVYSGLALMLIPVMLHGMLKEGIATWVPTMITETYGSSPAFSIFISAVLPIINLSGVFIAMFIYGKVTKENEILSSAIVMSIAILPLFLLLLIGRIPSFVAVILLASVTTLMHGFNHLLLTMASMRFRKAGRAATTTGMLNSVTYGGCAISGYGFGALAEGIGWQGSVWIWIGIAAVAAVVCFGAVRRWTRFSRELGE